MSAGLLDADDDVPTYIVNRRGRHGFAVRYAIARTGSSAECDAVLNRDVSGPQKFERMPRPAMVRKRLARIGGDVWEASKMTNTVSGVGTWGK